MLDSIKKTVEVPGDAAQAFSIFVDRIATWWPLDKNSVSAMQGEVAKEVVIEPKLDGKVYEIGHDDTVHDWGKVTAYEPGKHLALDWHIGFAPSNASKVDIYFTDIEDDRTRVDLSHGNWEAFGDKCESMRDGYAQGWVGVFENAYADACKAG